jgi:glycosyltransferase involved in cell wall biosynthesis
LTAATTIDDARGLTSTFPPLAVAPNKRGRESTPVTDNTVSTVSSRPKVSIIIPVYNQEKQITDLLTRIRGILKPIFTDYELIVVNDGSKDNTLDALRKEQEELKLKLKLRVISYNENRGKGYAVKQGVIQSTGDIVLFIDGDLEISPEAISEYITELEYSDLVIASKAHQFSDVVSPRSRKVLSKMFNLLVRVALGIRLKDTQSGMKAGKGSVLRAIFRTMLVNRYAFDVEMLVIASLFHLTIKEMPVKVIISKRFKLQEIVRMAMDVAAISYRLNINHLYYKMVLDMYISSLKVQPYLQTEDIALINKGG